MQKLAILLLLLSPNVFSTSFSSSDKQVQLVELYTSEGCSSCPPADRFLSQLKNHPKLWTEFVPVAFHVDYWNWLGWDDQFSDKAFSKRQRNLKQQKAIGSVYTPGFVVNGKEWRAYFSGSREFYNQAQTEKVGKLKVTVNNRQWQANFNPLNGQSYQRLNVALLAMGIDNKIKSGENKNKTLTHDFVVLDHQVLNSNGNRWQGNLPLANDSLMNDQLAVVFWVEQNNSLLPIQVTGGYL